MSDPEITDDPDVAGIFLGGNLMPGLLGDEAKALFFEFANVDMETGPESSAEMIVGACAAGVRCFERMTSLDADDLVGWRKFVLFNTGCNVQMLWSDHGAWTESGRSVQEAGIFADWVVATIGRYGWGPDGNQSALGCVHSNCIALATRSGAGVRKNPLTGKYEAPTGDEARELAFAYE